VRKLPSVKKPAAWREMAAGFESLVLLIHAQLQFGTARFMVSRLKIYSVLYF
jgi:hypothetical protein